MKLFRFAVVVVLFALIPGCKKTADTTPNYKSAINSYYEAHPACLFANEKRFPVQSSPDDAKTEGYDALVDAGLLTRTTSEKKIIIVSKRENNYDISENGRSAWTTDPNQPGYGNFCYGHRSVSSIDSSTPTSDQPGATTTVNYHYTMNGVPAWANAAETQTAFPRLRENLAGVGTATLTNTSNGWQVTGSPGNTSATPADGRIVQ